VQAHTLGEVGNLGTVLLRVYSGTLVPIFIEIGSYLTDEEQKISWHSFFETRCIWNDLPSDITSSPSLLTFKQRLKCTYSVVPTQSYLLTLPPLYGP